MALLQAVQGWHDTRSRAMRNILGRADKAAIIYNWQLEVEALDIGGGAMERIQGTFRSVAVILSVLALPLLTTCEDVPVVDVSRTFTVEVSQVSESEGAIKLDILWVIDNSSSMCQEQWTLARSFSQFAVMLSTYLEQIDIRLAVVTTDVGQKGVFQNKPAKQFPPPCVEQKIWACLGGNDCSKKFGAGWGCDPPQNAEDLYNINGSINSTCVYQCGAAGECCEEFCFEDECGTNASCLKDRCKDVDSPDCNFACNHPEGGEANGCQRRPDTEDCPSNVPKVLTRQNMDLFKCIATVEPQQQSTANMEQGLKTAWWALDPNGPNQGQSAGFLRQDAYLVVVYVTDEDDCSIHESFGAPNEQCKTDAECAAKVPFSKCKTDVRLSQFNGEEKKVCTGQIKKDYYNKCSLLGLYKGATHHACAYDPGCPDCSVDSDCEYGWHCKEVKKVKKCRPNMYSFPSIADYAQNAGTPLFVLSPVSDYYSRLRSLKPDPAKVLVAAITGDSVLAGNDKDSLISQKCLDNENLPTCREYVEAKKSDAAGCEGAPGKEGCEAYRDAMLGCAHDCYLVSKAAAVSAYACQSEYGKADYGSRYADLARMFGPNGLVSNLCSKEGIAPALETIAELIIKRVTKICLPLPVKEGETIVVTKTVVKDGVEESVRLIEGEPGQGDFKFEYPTQDCCDADPDTGECRGTLKAITFNDVLEPTARIEVKYEAALTE
jgi:hypothetical protein